MAFSASALSAEPRAFSVGPFKIEIQTLTMATSDTSGTVTATRLHEIDACVIVGGPECTGNVITNTTNPPTVALTFADPAAACTGYAAASATGFILLFGR